MIALFDMDGTLFACDSQLRFARWILRRHGWRRLYLLAVIPCALLRLLHLMDTEQMKRVFLCYAWGMGEESLRAECRAFVDEEILPALYPDVLKRLHAHQQAGDTTVLCSASPDWWTQIVGERLGFTHTLGTPVPLHGAVPWMPPIPPPGNNKGAHKLKRLAAIGITHADIGYTDSSADLPMLSVCKKAVLINPRPSFARQLPEAEVLTPPSGLSPFFALRCLAGL